MAAAYRRPLPGILAASGIELLPLPAGARWRPEDVPDGIRAARTAAGLSKVALGRAVGRSGQAVRSWETGRSRPGPDSCRRLELVLGLPPGKLPF
jgi:DNA-binding XRE family transcriptional regulator